jgi:Mrp family chromosome partitioning ATPase
MKKFIDGAREQFDFIVIDTPPHGPVVDPTIVAGHLSDVVVFVVRWASTPRDAVQRAVRQLSRHVKIAGVVFNLVDEAQAKKYGDYGDALYYARGAYGKYYHE